MMLLCSGCADTATDKAISQSVALIDPQRLRGHVENLAALGPRSSEYPAALQHTLAYIRMKLDDYRVDVREEALAATAESSMVNLIVVFPGDHADKTVLEFGAHYDTVATTPGADDNASGVAALLEIARVLSDLPNRRTIRLCFFAEEENGREGSIQHVRNLTLRNEKLAGAVILEMVGYTNSTPGSQGSPVRIPLLFWPPDTGDFVAVVGNFTSGSLGNRFESAAARYVPELPLFSANRLGGLFEDALRGDHKPYWDQNYKAIMLTDTADFRNPHYHRPTDTPDTLDYEFLTAITRAALATAITWSGLAGDTE
ncbi:MAG: M20/M25/M40 family metallo-hydrolase [Thiogranum sp.]|nr:M20/M25/M40 family metallo-hydrolase [Thiogranum sp.]